MNCKRCGSDDVTRSRRRGLWDYAQSTLGNWPYRCEDCGYRFVTRYRYPAQAPVNPEPPGVPPTHHAAGQDFRAYAAASEREGPDMVFQTHEQRPHAKIVLQADTHEQLNQILVALNHAVNLYQTASKAKTESSGVPR